MNSDYRIKPLIKTMSYNQLQDTCEREGWLIPSVHDLRGSVIDYEFVWTSDKLDRTKVLTEDDIKHTVDVGICYSPETDKQIIVNKRFMMECVVLVPLEKKTSVEWMKDKKYEGITILDPDGWDRSNYEYSFNEEEITESQFFFRLSNSTCMREVKK